MCRLEQHPLRSRPGWGVGAGALSPEPCSCLKNPSNEKGAGVGKALEATGLNLFRHPKDPVVVECFTWRFMVLVNQSELY